MTKFVTIGYGDNIAPSNAGTKHLVFWSTYFLAIGT